jgi:hypothetical protein
MLHSLNRVALSQNLSREVEEVGVLIARVELVEVKGLSSSSSIISKVQSERGSGGLDVVVLERESVIRGSLDPVVD